MSQTRRLPALIFLTLLLSFLPPAFLTAQAQTVMPDGIAFVDPATTLRAGASYTISLQLTLQGANYSGGSFGIYLSTDNPRVLDIPWGTAIVSDSSGRASLNVTAGPDYGNVTVTAAMLSPDGRVRKAKAYAVKGFSQVNGTVLDSGGKGVPHATVILYTINNSTRGEMVSLSGNPAATAGAETASPGAYAFSDVPYGSYFIEATVDGNAANVTLAVSSPTQSADLVIAGYTVPTPTPTPTPEPTAGASPTVTPAPASPTPAPKTSTGDETRQIIWILAAALVLAAIIVGAVLLKRRKK